MKQGRLLKTTVVTLLLIILGLLVDVRMSRHSRYILLFVPNVEAQSEVGGVNEVNQLFKGENVGKQPDPEQGSGLNWLLIIGLSTGVLVFILLGVFVLKRSDDES